ncbi:putative spermine spermidine synthase [Lyophyllum shimeji]|uniref:Spermine spermidine synthase n=1 Tax=Lyophyllum shimeji TaxID=47721 RepID=A0A9P3UHI0_LYOSH|nr:putative spermine spermidine synthase [Lyophyllum shimeji]
MSTSKSLKPPKRDVPKSPLVSPVDISNAAISLLSISLVLFIYERALVPLYGSGPTTYLLDKFVGATVVLAVINPWKVSTTRKWLYLAVALALAPNATYWVAVWTSRMKDAVVGPAITHASVIAPLVFLLTTAAVDAQEALVTSTTICKTSPHVRTACRVVAAAICFVVGQTLSQRLWANLSFLNNISESQVFLGLACLFWCIWISRLSFPVRLRERQIRGSFSANQLKSIFIIASIAFWGYTYQKLAAPVLPHPLREAYTHPAHPIQIHSSVQSTTGVVVVGEALPPPDYDRQDDEAMHSVRYLRASHSILGGVWTGSKVHVLDDEPPQRDSFGTPLGDSIYSTFVLQEAARLVNSTKRAKDGLWENALIIGLGTGTSATAFSRHGISNTVVEIDPAVYDAARTFFGLPDPGPEKVFLEDARSWVSQKRASVRAGNNETLYDIVVHDCFSGGGVPEHIFTMEFWEDLKSVMHSEGVLAVNFAGILKSDATKMVLLTLEKSFAQCRAFHDLFAEMTDAQYDVDFVNVVFFCTPSKAPLTFRRSRRSDWLGSPLRRHVLNSLATREVKLDLIRDPSDDEGNSKYILTDDHNPLGRFQDEQSLHHWRLMRQVLPDIHWETY